MKIILSRKGFDSANGGCPSPILPNKQMISMPIPSGDNSGLRYSDLSVPGLSGLKYSELWNMLSTRQRKEEYCHLDPDIRKGNRVLPNGWSAAFGQIDIAEGHLENHNVGPGDLFLFFGLFQETKKNEANEYKYYGEQIHALYGYLQIDKIIEGTAEIKKEAPWHPHAAFTGNNNTLYIASNKLTIDGNKTDYPGYGTFKFSNNLKLTKDGYSKSKWNMPEFFKEVEISYHTKNSFKEDYFQSAHRGQEFVISEDERVTNWALEIIKNNIEN